MGRTGLRGDRARRRGFSWVDGVAVLVLIVFGISMLVPSLCRSSETANRVKCASNLRQIGQAILLYANDNGGAYPRTTWSHGSDAKPVFGTGVAARDPFTGVEPNDVTAAMFLLLRTQDITAEVFTCPSSNAEKDDFGGGRNAATNRGNFTNLKKNLSYSLHNPYVKDGVVPRDDTKYWTISMSAEFPVAADINPGTGGGNDVLAVSAISSAKDMKRANSNNHDMDGQNILYGDGHVAWESNPFVGVNRDNIYTTADNRVATSPVDVNDSILLPTDD